MLEIIKRVLIGMFFLCLFVDSATAQVWHVTVTLKNAKPKQGYIFSDSRDFNKFLEFYKSQKQAFNGTFPLYSTRYAINDGGILGGYACCGEESESIPLDLVAGISALDDPHNGILSEVFSKAEIKLMQTQLVCSDVAEDGFCSLGFFNYNPSISKKEIHHLLESTLKNDKGNPSEFEEFCRKMEKKKVIVISFRCDTSD